MKPALSALVLLAALALAVSAGAQQQPPVPQPYPKPGQQQAPARPAQPTQPETAQPTQATPSQQPAGEPSEATLGLPIYPSARFLTSYDAGRGQRFYLFGTTASFADVVGYYKSVLRQKGDLVFEEPATHVFEVGRFKEDTMAFPPSVTIKDYTWGGMQGYANPKPGAEPASFPTVIQLVPIPPATVAEGRQ